jgi:chemotaxis protein methyltransferase CheR
MRTAWLGKSQLPLLVKSADRDEILYTAKETVNSLSEFEFRLFRDHIHDYCGIYFEETKAQALASRLTSRMMVLDIASFSEYYNYLKFHPRGKNEMADLIPRLTNNETYFFREINQLSFLVSRVEEKIKQGGGSPSFRVLSCGCSSGEEAYTLAIMLEEAGVFGRCEVEITGMDIDRKILHKASAAEFTPYSLRSTSGERAEKYFFRSGEKYRLDERIRKRVNFIYGNLIDQDVFKRFKDVDAVMCRNVFIYFSDAAIGKAALSFYETLSGGGCLLLGHSESLSRVTDIFQAERHPNAIVYIKREI